jgi:type VI protein secretion system component Hcp
MARDIYIKFGETKELDEFNRPKPEIEGDSSDPEHFWWTEVRGCDFSIKSAERPKSNEDESTPPPEPGKEPHPTLNNAQISKKVDWGSTDLFQLCCQAPRLLKTSENIDPKEDEGQLKDVIIEVCRKSGVEAEGRYSFLTITFGGVYVVGYGISFGGPDPMEKITLKYRRVSFRYISADPKTGGIMDPYNADNMHGFPEKSASLTAIADSIAAGGAGAANSAGPAVASIAAVASAVPGGGGPAPPGGPAPDPVIAANFPGYMSVTGNGILAD